MTGMAARRSPGFRRSVAVGAATVLGGVALLVTPAMPASATGVESVPGYEIVSAVSATNSTSPKSMTVNCPKGKVLLGTGYVINGATGEVVVDVLRPNGDETTAPTSVYLRAVEEDAYSGRWNVQVYATCSYPISGLSRVHAVSDSNSSDYRTVRAECPGGKTLVGTGYEISGPSGEIVLDDFYPNGSETSAPNAVIAGAYEADPNYTGIWTLTAYGVCGYSIDGLVRARETGASNSNDYHRAVATCPTGKVVTGTGFLMAGVTGEGVVDDLIVSSTRVTVGAYEADPDYVGNWWLRAYAICATL